MNIKAYLESTKERPYQFARRAGVKWWTVYQLAKGEKPNLTLSTVRRIILATGGKVGMETLL